jgi:aspartate/methionine/tyrosine aminotransferase
VNIFKLEEYLGRYEFSAKYLLCCSDAESFSMSEILDLASNDEKDLWNNLRLGYTEVHGMPLLRETIARELYPELESDNILMFAGAEDGIFCALHALIESGDHVIVITPCYQSLLEIPKLKGAEISEIQLQEENEWKIDTDAIKNAIKSNTKCVVINFPHNPTGQIIEQSELLDLVEICKSKNILIFSDEVYRLLGQPDNQWSSPAACVYDRALSLGVMSKSFGMPGLRVGWIACQNKQILKKIEYVKHYTTICNSAPSEILGLIGINNKDKILERNNEIVESNLSLLDKFFVNYKESFKWVRPQGGCVGFVKYIAKDNSKDNVNSFCEKLVNEKEVLLLPSSAYDYNKSYFRIGFGRKNMPEALEKFEEFLSTFITI